MTTWLIDHVCLKVTFGYKTIFPETLHIGQHVPSDKVLKMRQKRAKAYRKLMHMYSMSFGFRQPYQVLGKCNSGHKILLNVKTKLSPLYGCILCLCHNLVFCTLENRTPVDSQMCLEATSSKIDLAKQLATVSQGTVKPSVCHLPSTSLTHAHYMF